MDTSPDLPTRRPRVMVLFGGRSGEHAISCATAGGVLRAVDRERYDVLAVGITPAGRWVLAEDDPDRWAITGGRLPQVEDWVDYEDHRITVREVEGRRVGRVEGNLMVLADVVF